MHLPSRELLRQYVQDVLCTRGDLDFGCPMTESEVILNGQIVGIEFTLFGGRAIRLSAIWDRITNSIRFYDHKLEKFLVTPIVGPINELQRTPSETNQTRTRSVFAAR